MFFVSGTMETAPDSYKSHLQETVYELLTKLQIPFERVSTDEAISMEDCIKINPACAWVYTGYFYLKHKHRSV
ncbi:hypothetical protein [Neobacillus niacini]|uniref:hypothetical protein n=1 Tax=Neobacillus niacini TaxID=86668 RepID=UPI00285D213A|nr:hypothetical protein [Neobacillus niacini]MDR6999721.1 hypothetical protein [Neobacillus niacini]